MDIVRGHHQQKVDIPFFLKKSVVGRRGNSTEKRPSTGNQEKDEQIEIRRINNRIHQRMKRDKDKAQQEAENERDKVR